jgi:hypothetical protein
MGSAYRALPELEEGVLPEWLRLLGAMGLHVFGEGEEVIVQDRAGQSEAHDAYRLLLIERFIEEQVRESPLPESDLPESNSDLSGRLGAPPNFAQEVREQLRAGFWDLAAAEPLPADSAEGEWRAFPKTSAFHAARRRRCAVPHVAPRARARDLEAELGWLRPRTETTRAFWGSLQRMGAVVDDFGAASLAQQMALLPLLPCIWFLRPCLLAVYALVVFLEGLTFESEGATPAAPLDDRAPLLQLHEALILEGLARRNPVAGEQWVVHLESVLAEYRASIERGYPCPVGGLGSCYGASNTGYDANYGASSWGNRVALAPWT